MRKILIANSDKTLLDAIREIQEAYGKGDYLSIKIDTGRQRTDQQRKAIEVFCRNLAETLNESGFDMQAVFKVKNVSVPWSQETAKDCLFRPIGVALFSKESTADLERGDCSRIHQVLSRQLGESLGLTVPAWPSKERE